MDDIRAVLDAVGAERAVLVGSGAGGQPCAMFAATYPERTRALVLVSTPAPAVKTEDYPYGLEPDAWREQLREVRQRWGERDYFEQQARMANPRADDEFVEWFVTCQRFNASPGAALNFYRVLGETDLRDVLASVSVPTLVLHGPAQRDEMLDVARRVPDARSVALPADTLIETFGDIARETRAFVEGAPPDLIPDSVLATILFTDLVSSTERAAALGDRAWRDLLTRHREDVRRELARFRGEEVDSAGDGFFCRFDGPARAIACASAIVSGARKLDLDVRAGIHTGECEVVGRSSRVSQWSPVLVSQRSLTLARCLFRKPSRMSSPARGSVSSIVESTSSRAFRAHGVYTPSTTAEERRRPLRALGGTGCPILEQT
jgi:hypothetical protein